MILPSPYRKYPPTKNTTIVSIGLHIYDIPEIHELEMKYMVKLKVEMQWYDSRIVFRNLKSNQETKRGCTKNDNQLSKTEIDKIWTPKLLFDNSQIGSIEAGRHNDADVSDDSSRGYVDIMRMQQKLYKNSLEEMYENYVYLGKENAIRMKNYAFVMLQCKFDLRM